MQINISQKEYEDKYRLYLELVNSGRRRNARAMMSSLHDQETDAAEEDDDETDLQTMHTFRPSEYP